MKKIIFLLCFFVALLAQKSFAQPTFSFTPAQVQVDEGDQVCLDLIVEDFTDILSVQFTVTFDPGVLQFQGPPTNLNSMVTGLDVADFGIATANLGYITFIWSNGQPCQSATSGVTLPDGSLLFSLCFLATGDYGFHTPVSFASAPIDRITRRLSANCIDIGEFTEDGFISIGTSPLKINIGSADGYTNDVVCVDFKVEDFTNIVSTQYYIFWDTSILEFMSAMPMNLQPSQNYVVNGSQALGRIISTYYAQSVTTGYSVPDGTQILQACFRIKGNCGQSSPIYIDVDNSIDPPGPIEIIDAVTGGNPMGVNIGLLHTEGQVSVNCFDPNSITINMDDKNVCPGETFSVDVKVEDFSQIGQLTFNLKWNPSIIEYQSVSYPVQPGGANCLPFANGVDDSQAVSQGIFEMDWSTQGQGCNKADGYIIFRLHFKAIGPSGSNTTIAVVDPIFVDKFGGQPVNIGINNNNSLVTLCQLSNPTIVASSENGNPGSTVCVDFTVQDFDNITSMGYTLAWEPGVMQFTGLQGFNLAGLSQSNFNTTQAGNLGVMSVDWSNAAGVSVPDGVSIFTACFQLLGDPNDCSTIEFTDSPWPINIETTVSNATNVGLNGQPGQVCIENPFLFKLTAPEVYSGQFSNICVDVTVENFNQLTNTEYSINWDPDILNFTGLVSTGLLPNFSSSSYDISNASDGNLTIDWASLNQVLGTSVPNGTSIFQLCFEVLGFSGECSPIAFTNFPQATLINSATTGNANLTLGTDNGSICVSGSMNLVGYTVTDVSCGGSPNGAIDITISGGSGQYTYQWVGPGVSPTAADQTNLNVGSYAVTVTDALNPSLKIIQPFNVVYTPDATYANAGQDTTFSCGSFFMTLNGTGSSTGPNTTYLWQSIGSGLVLPGQQDTITPQIIGGSMYKLTVTGPGCIDIDTVNIAAAQIPVPYIDSLPDKITCSMDTVILDGSLSPFGFEAMWTGPAVVPGTETYLTPKVTAPGIYVLTMSSPVTGCAGSDSVLVESNLDLPTADAGSDDLLGCNDTSIPLGGASSSGPSFIYDWVPVDGGQICGNPQAMNISACSAGTFQLTVTDTLNGCSAMDEVVITSDTQKPISDAGDQQTLDCVNNEVELDGTGSSSNGDYTYTWTLLSTNTVVAQNTLTPLVSQPGIYQLEVVDTSNGCSAFSEVEVMNASTLPIIMGTASNPITCAITSSTLDGTGSATGPGIIYEWLNGAGATIASTLQTTVNQPDTYQLLVTNTQTSCVSTLQVVVGNQTTPPDSEAGPEKSINCFGDPTLEGQYDSSNPNLDIQWTGPGQGCIANGNIPNPTVSCPGWYKLLVVDNLTGCVGIDSVLVGNDLTPPIANAGIDLQLPCASSSVELQGSTDASNFTVLWSPVTGNLPISDPSILTPTVTQAGTYSLIVTNTANGCTSAADLVTVTLGSQNWVANAGTDSTVDCQNTLATLDASGSSPNVTYQWQQIVGGVFSSDQVSVEVPAGVYQLTIIGVGGCQDTDTVTVTDIAIDIDATASASGDISCESASVVLTGNSSVSGPTISYVWTNADGLIIGNGLNATVDAPGIYTWTVSDSQTGCSGTAQVTVEQNDSNLVDASAQVDYAVCETDAMLIGNLPPNTTGLWTSPTGASITDPTAATTSASNLKADENVFVWTLSLGDCLDYSSDTVTILVDNATPNAVDDNTTLQPGVGGQVTFNVLENDDFDAANSTFNLLPFNGFGSVTASDSGSVVFLKEKCFVGKVEIQYEVCDIVCPDLCDQATLTIDVLPDAADGCGDIPNGITPNGDGVNDALVFDILLDISQNFPDNEIIIFNRWGDEVYKAKPYNNDWRGTNKNGDELPQATYYYILRLNIGDGEIIRGDVTIIK